MQFKDIEFPEDISYNSSVTSEFSTDLTQNSGGYVSNNINRDNPLKKFDVTYGIRKLSDLRRVLALHYVVQGSGYAFKIKDFMDFSSNDFDKAPTKNDVQIGTGDGTDSSFQLFKVYNYGGETKKRDIQKPDLASLIVAIDGTETTDYSVTSQGVVLFNSAPADGAIITAGFYFFVPVFFLNDQLTTSITTYQSGEQSIVLKEVVLA